MERIDGFMFQWDEDKKRRWGVPLIINMMLLMVLMVCLNGCSSHKEETESNLESSYAISDTLETPSSTEPDSEENTTSATTQEETEGQKEDSVNALQSFSDLAEYKDVIYQNVQLGDYAQADWVQLPVDSNFFTVANDKIYYVPGTDWDMYFGDPITYSLYRCNLDGSQQECLFTVDNCQMGTAGICGNYLYGEYYLNDKTKDIAIDLTTGEVKEIHMACTEGEYGKLLGMSDSYLYYDCGSQIYRSDYEGKRAESIYAYENGFDTLNSLSEIKIYENAIYALQLVDNTGEQNDYTYDIVRLSLEPSSQLESLPLTTKGLNSAQFQIRDGKIYTVEGSDIYSFTLADNLRERVAHFDQTIYGPRVKCKDDQGTYVIFGTEIDEKTNTDEYCVLVKDDGSYQTLAGWYVS